MLGESEVLGQVRRAWEKAQSEQVSGPVLGALFRHAIETGKRVRSETAIARGITSLSHAAVALAARRRRRGLEGARVLVVGAGEMGEGVAQALGGQGVDSVVVANRTADRTEALVAGLPGTLADRVRTEPVDDLGPLLAGADVVFTSVGTTLPIIDRVLLSEVVAARTAPEPLLVVDLGVPRNVEPAARRPPGPGARGHGRRCGPRWRTPSRVVRRRRPRPAGSSATRSSGIRVASRARDAAPIVSALRAQVEEARESAFDRQRARRSDLTDAQWEQVDAVTRSMVAKLLHQPTVALKDAAGTPRGERLVEALRTLFDL